MAKRPKSIQTPSRLGRGLSSLIGPTVNSAPEPTAIAQRPPVDPSPPPEAPPNPAAVLEIPVDQIAPNPHQPRRTFDEAQLAELTASIRAQGILQPLLVARGDSAGDRPYVLIAGERRLRAARNAALSVVPCVVRQAGTREMIEWSLIENIQRADLNPVERAQAYRGYMDQFGLTQAEVADRTGQARASVANYLRMLDLSDDVQQLLLEGKLTFGHAKALAGLAGRPEQQLALAARIERQGLSVRQAEQLVAAARDGAGGDAPAPKRASQKPPYVTDMEGRLTRAVGTRVTIAAGRAKNTGRIVIDYYSLDDFDRVAALLGLDSEV